jgi:TonB-dependent receptor
MHATAGFSSARTSGDFDRPLRVLLLLCAASTAILPAASYAQSADPAQSVEQDAAAGPPATIVANNPARKVEKAKAKPADVFENPAADGMFDDLGPFFGFSTFNGREITGSSNFRDISFRQFPIELQKEVGYRSFYAADQVEGALFGLTTSEALRPLDLKKRRIQAEVRGIYSSYADRTHQSPGKRGSLSYVDQFDTGIGRIGVSAGLMVSNSFLPKDFYKGTTAVKPCNSVGAVGNCTYDPNSTNELYFPTGSHTFRQQRSDEKQRAYFATIQWQPNEKWDIMIDGERSSRVQSRYRSEFSLTEGFRNITPLEIAPSGALLRFSGESELESLAFARTRDEKYTGFGFNVRFHPTDHLEIRTDLSYSRTDRSQTDISASVASNDLAGPGGRAAYTLDLSRGGVPYIEFANGVDINNYDLFTEGAAVRRGRDIRRDAIKAARADVIYQAGGFFETIKAGMRYSSHRRDGSLLTYQDADIPAENVAQGTASCRRGPITDDFLGGTASNINSWAVFDPACLYAAFTGSTDFDQPLATRTGGELHISEKILAGYVMGDFKSELAGMPLSGNLGVRITQTRRHTSLTRYTGNPAPIEDRSGSLIDFLPSANAVVQPAAGLEVEASVYRTLLRSAIDGFNLRRVIAGPAGSMERQDPIKAWNLDMAVRYKPMRDTALSLDLFYKFLNSSAWPGDLIIPGGPVLNPALRADSLKSSYIRGFGVSVRQGFSSLPAPLDGVTLEASYAFADSNFHFNDPSATDPANPLYLFVAPAGVPGLSRHSVTLSGNYEKNRFGLGATYEYRSGYFRPTGLTANRVLGPTNYLNAYVSYKIDDHLQLRLAALNLTKEHETLYRPVAEAAAQTSYFGRTYSLSLRLRY